MENSGCRWDKQEDIQLTKLFKTYSMDIHEIAQIHRRSLESIRLRLIKFGLIQENNTSKQVSLDEQEFNCNLKLLKKINEQEKRINLLELSNLEQNERIKLLELKILSSLD